MKTELIMLAVWSAVMLQSGVLPTSYITNVKNENVQAYLTQQEAQDIFLPFFSEQDLSENETSLLTSTGETERDEELLEEVDAKHQETMENVEQDGLDVEKEEMEPIVSEAVQEQGQEEDELQTAETVEKEDMSADTEKEELQEGEEKSFSEADSGEEQKVELQGDEEIAEKEETEPEQAESRDTEADKISEIQKKLEQRETEREAERKAKKEQIEAERKAREEAERIAREEAEKAEAERIAKEEAEKARAEAERIAKEEAEKAEAERIAKEEAEARKLNTDPNTLTFLVNKEYALPADYVPKLVEPQVNHRQPTGSHKRYMRAEAAAALEEMFAAAKADGYDLWVKTAYRSYKNQYDTYTWVLKYRGMQEAVYYHAVPGRSEHQTGLAVDIVCEASDYENDWRFENTKECAWLKENCYKYGFILRYLEGMEHITGYNYEPWHYRYVGVELATYLMENNLTLEEYYQALPTTDLFQVPEEYRHLIQDKTESN